MPLCRKETVILREKHQEKAPHSHFSLERDVAVRQIPPESQRGVLNPVRSCDLWRNRCVLAISR